MAADVVLIHGKTLTGFSKSSGTDGTPLSSACAAAVAGDAIAIAPGTFSFSGQLVFPAGVAVRGAGRRRTVLTSSLISTSVTAFNTSGDGIQLSSMSIVTSIVAPNFVPLLGVSGPNSEAASTNLILSDLYLLGSSDGLYFNGSVASSVRVYDSELYTQYDLLRMLGSGVHDVRIYNSIMKTVGSSSTFHSRTLAVAKGTLEVYNCDVTATDDGTIGSGQTVACLYADGGNINAHGCKLTSSSTSIAAPKDIRITTSASTISVDQTTSFDKTKVNFGTGSFKILGDQSVKMAAVAADTTVVIPAGWVIAGIDFEELVGGTGVIIKIGTTSGGTDVIASYSIGAGAVNSIPSASILQKYFSSSADTTIYLQAVSSWGDANVNFIFRMVRVWP